MDSRAKLVLVAVIALQVVIVAVIVSVAFPDWRPPFLGEASQEPVVPGRLAALPPSTDASPDALSKPTDAAASRMLFGGPGSAVLGDHVPEAPRPAPASPGSTPATGVHPPATGSDGTRGAAQPSQAEQQSFEQYLDWLRNVELERLSLRTWGERHLPSGVGAEPEPRQRSQALHLAAQEVSAFRQRILRRRPVVPPDCRIVDQYYLGAIAQEGSQTADLLEALEQQDRDRVRQLQRSGTNRIDRDLTVANAKLEQTFRKRGRPQELRIETGVDASLLGSLTELPASP